MKLTYFKKPKNLSSLLRKNFITGIFVLAPIAVVSWIIFRVLETLWQLREILPESWKPENYFEPTLANLLDFFITLGLTFLFILLISILGWISKQYIGTRFLGYIGHFIQRIPIVRAIYTSLNQLLKTMASSDKQQFNRVVYVEYPRKGSWSLAFVTGKAHFQHPSKIDFLNIFIPTTPNPTSGFYLMVPESEVIDAHLSVEEAFKTILSLGIAQDDKNNTT